MRVLVHDAAHLSLVTFSPTSLNIRDALMRMALANDSTPAMALFYALLALSSLRRSGLQLEAMQFKVAALHTLSNSAKRAALSSDEAIQHVATCMLLCAFEVGYGDCTWVPSIVTLTTFCRSSFHRKTQANGFCISGEPWISSKRHVSNRKYTWAILAIYSIGFTITMQSHGSPCVIGATRLWKRIIPNTEASHIQL